MRGSSVASRVTFGGYGTQPARREPAPYTSAIDSTAANPRMRIAIGSDHAAFELKRHLTDVLVAQGHEVDDHGAHGPEPTDYPPICAAVGRTVRDGEAQVGIVLGGSGQGEQMSANKVRGVRAALCNDLYTARMARAHNDANVLSIGARIVGIGLAEEIVATFLGTHFEGGRHARRVEQITEIEAIEAGDRRVRPRDADQRRAGRDDALRNSRQEP